jgi:hypothetical protein
MPRHDTWPTTCRFLNGEADPPRPVDARTRLALVFEEQGHRGDRIGGRGCCSLRGGLLGLVLLFVSLLRQRGNVPRSAKDATKASENALREEINGLQTRADRDLGAAHDEPDSQKALQIVSEVAGLRREVQDRLAQLPPAPEFAAEQERLWQRRWLTCATRPRAPHRTELRRFTASPEGPRPRAPHGRAVSPDGSWLVLGYTKIRSCSSSAGIPAKPPAAVSAELPAR